MPRPALVLAASLLSAVAACGKAAHDNDAAVDADVGNCTTGPMHCDGNQLQRCVDGDYQDTELCPDACSDQYGCVLCKPGTGTCVSDTLSHACNEVGTGYEDVTCDPVQGMSCGATTGICEGACSPHSLGQSYIGCEYYPTVTGNMVSNQYQFAVVITNTTPILATVHIEGGALDAPVEITVPPGGVTVEKVPWVVPLKLCLAQSWKLCVDGGTDGALVARGAYHLRSTAPVTVYQFNPLDYSLPNTTENSISNDASLLLPTNVWRALYYVASWPHTGLNPSELAVTAWQDATQVTITSRADSPANGGAPAFTANVPQTITLGAGDVLELTSRTGDFTGSLVSSDKPVQVIGAHYGAAVPPGVNYADHLEESMVPVDALGARYVISAPALKTAPDGKIQVVRVIATAADTTLTYDPPQSGAPTHIASAGDFVEIDNTAASFVLAADKKILVAEYMEGSQATADNYGDPSMALAVPVDQFRSKYLFQAPTNYAYNYVDVIAPVGATVSLDGAPLTFTPIAATGFAIARSGRLDRGANMDGNHAVTGSKPFGISVYGYGIDTSYWYMGGLDVHEIVVQ